MSYGGNADSTGIQVTFLDQTGAKSVKAVIAFSVRWSPGSSRTSSPR